MTRIFFILFLLSPTLATAQNVLNNNPAAIKWNQVNTSHFKVIYPKGIEAEAQRVANTMQHIRMAESKTIGKAPRKIPIILQSQSSVSNAFVSITPRRSEFYMMPTQDYNFLGSNDWLTLLAAHEYRHVVQYENAITGFNKLFYYMFGPATSAAMANVAAPLWFWEGDAVVAETAFTQSGRGRIPNFNVMFRTNLLEGRTFNYHKQYLRSYKHFIPNHYVLGYNMISYLREKTNDPTVWGKIAKRSWSIPFLPFPFSNSIHNVVGVYVTKLYKEMAAEYAARWKQETDSLLLTPFERVHTRKSNAYTNYQYPQVLENGSVVAMKSGIGDIDQLILLSTDKELKMFTPGILNDGGMLSAANSKVIWNEYEYDPRWRVKNYSVIKLYDFNTRKEWRVTKKSRYASAALSPDGSKVVTIETNDQYKTSLTVLDVFYGKVLLQFPNPENHFYSMPRFSDDGNRIVVLKTTMYGKTISIIDVTTGSITDVFPIGYENIGHPVLQGDYLYFNSPVSGIDNIYAYSLSTKTRYQVTVSKYGAYNPALSTDGHWLYYNEQTANGLDVVRCKVQPANWKVLHAPVGTKSFYEFLAQQEGRPSIMDSIPQQKLSSKKYSKFAGIINPISWGAYFDSDLTGATVGVISQDILSTTAVSAGYYYNITEQRGQWNTTISYQGFFPILDISASITDRSINEGDIPIRIIERNPIPPKDTTRNEVVERNLTLSWKEKNILAGIRIPLVTTRSKYRSGVDIGNHIGYTNVTEFSNSLFSDGRFVPAVFVNDTVRAVYRTTLLRNYVGNNQLLYNQFKIRTYRLLKTSTRDFLPRWGQLINMEWYKTGFGSDLNGSLFAVYAQLYFPGVAKHHSFNGYGAYQKTLFTDNFRNNYIFSNRVPAPRGQSIFRAENFYSTSANYALPLWYPDISIGPLLNIQRIRLNGFFDFAYGKGELSGTSRSYTSVGAEVKFDVNVMRFLPQLDIGFRYTVGLKPSVNTFEFLLGTINF